MPEVKIRKMV